MTEIDFRESVMERNPKYKNFLEAHNNLWGTEVISGLRTEKDWQKNVYEPVTEEAKQLDKDNNGDKYKIEDAREAYNWFMAPHVKLILKRSKKVDDRTEDCITLPESTLEYLNLQP
ncbi:MAG: hypothetical protein JSV92_00270 [archaeon]|nr:MAG: hypothetical protein JSV92_00270 [archaeon]